MRESIQNAKSVLKRLTLSADEKLMRDNGMKDDCGEYTELAKDIVMEKLVKEHEEAVVEAAKELQKEREAQNK